MYIVHKLPEVLIWDLQNLEFYHNENAVKISIIIFLGLAAVAILKFIIEFSAEPQFRKRTEFKVVDGRVIRSNSHFSK